MPQHRQLVQLPVGLRAPAFLGRVRAAAGRGVGMAGGGVEGVVGCMRGGDGRRTGQDGDAAGQRHIFSAVRSHPSDGDRSDSIRTRTCLGSPPPCFRSRLRGATLKPARASAVRHWSPRCSMAGAPSDSSRRTHSCTVVFRRSLAFTHRIQNHRRLVEGLAPEKRAHHDGVQRHAQLLVHGEPRHLLVDGSESVAQPVADLHSSRALHLEQRQQAEDHRDGHQKHGHRSLHPQL